MLLLAGGFQLKLQHKLATKPCIRRYARIQVTAVNQPRKCQTAYFATPTTPSATALNRFKVRQPTNSKRWPLLGPKATSAGVHDSLVANSGFHLGALFHYKDEASRFLLVNTGIRILVPVLIAVTLYYLIKHAAERAKKFASSPEDTSAESVGKLALAVEGPLNILLPIVVLSHLFRGVVRIVDIYMHRYAPELPPWADVCVHTVMDSVEYLDNVFLRSFVLMLLIFLCWVFLRWKNIVVESTLLNQKNLSQEVEDIVRPFSLLITWAAIVATILLGMRTLGVDITTLLTVGGVSSLAIGLASQSVLTNVISGLNIFFTRPFIRGDDVTLQSPGLAIKGNVLSIRPMRTVLKGEGDVKIALPNKMVADMIVYNHSRVVLSSGAQVATLPSTGADLKVKALLRDPKAENLFKLKNELKEKLSKNQFIKKDASIRIEEQDRSSDGLPILIEIKEIARADTGASNEVHKLLLEINRIVQKYDGHLECE